MQERRGHQSPAILSLMSLLPEDDVHAYTNLQNHFQMVISTHKHSGVSQFRKQLEAVHSYILRNHENQAIRAMLCGIFFGREYILVNTARFKDLLYRSKSGMNNCFQKLHYDVMRPSNDIITLFQKLLPRVSQDVCNVNQWCVRLATDQTTVRFAPTIPDSVACSFEIDRIPSQRTPLTTESTPTREKGSAPIANLLDVASLLNK